MDESNDKCDWKKVFKKFLEPQKPAGSENIQINNKEEELVPVRSAVDQEKSISEISCSLASNDSGYSGCKFEYDSNLPSGTNNTFERNRNFPQDCDYKPEFNDESLLNVPTNHGWNMDIPLSNSYKTEFYNDLSFKKLSPHEFKGNSLEGSGCKTEFNNELLSNMQSHVPNVDIPHVSSVPKSKKTDNIRHDEKVPEWSKAFKNIIRDNLSVMDVPIPTVTIYPSKDARNFKNSNTPGSERKQSCYEPRRRNEKAKKYNKDYEVSESEEKVREIFALSRMFKLEQVDLNEFHGCGVNLFKQDPCSTSKSTCGSPRLIDKPYLPLTGCIAISKPYTAADVEASYVPFEEDAWDDELLI